MPPAKIPVGNLLPSLVVFALEPEAMTVEAVEEDKGGDVVDLEDVTAAVDDELAVGALEALEDAEDAEDVVSLPDLLKPRIRLHTALSSLFEAMQLYPKGQHLEPQAGNLSPVLVVKMVASGFLEASCKATSQGMVAILLQVFPSGQHRADVPLSNDKQFVPEPHLNAPGNLESTSVHVSTF